MSTRWPDAPSSYHPNPPSATLPVDRLSEITDTLGLEHFSGLRIADRVVGSSDLAAALLGRQVHRLKALATGDVSIWGNSASALKRSSLSGGTDVKPEGVQWVTIGVLSRKNYKESSTSGKRYAIWTLTDFTADVTLFVFGEAFEDLGCTTLGSIVLVASPVVLPADERRTYALSVNKRHQLTRLGACPNFGTCRGHRKDGQRCSVVVDTSGVGYCSSHFKEGFQAASRHHAELGRAHVTIPAEPKNISKGTYGGSAQAYIQSSGTTVSAPPPMPPPSRSGKGGSAAAPAIARPSVLQIDENGHLAGDHYGRKRARGKVVSDSDACAALAVAVEAAEAAGQRALVSGRGVRLVGAAISAPTAPLAPPPKTRLSAPAASDIKPPTIKPPTVGSKKPRIQQGDAAAGEKKVSIRGDTRLAGDPLLRARSHAPQLDVPKSAASLAARGAPAASSSSTHRAPSSVGLSRSFLPDTRARDAPPRVARYSAAAAASADPLGSLFCSQPEDDGDTPLILARETEVRVRTAPPVRADNNCHDATATEGTDLAARSLAPDAAGDNVPTPEPAYDPSDLQAEAVDFLNSLGAEDRVLCAAIAAPTIAEQPSIQPMPHNHVPVASVSASAPAPASVPVPVPVKERKPPSVQAPVLPPPLPHNPLNRTRGAFGTAARPDHAAKSLNHEDSLRHQNLQAVPDASVQSRMKLSAIVAERLRSGAASLPTGAPAPISYPMTFPVRATASSKPASSGLFAGQNNGKEALPRSRFEEAVDADALAAAYKRAESRGKLEAFHEQMANITTREVTRWWCASCSREYEKDPLMCRAERHKVDVRRKTVHALACLGCGTRIFHSQAHSAQACEKCGGRDWHTVSVHRVKGDSVAGPSLEGLVEKLEPRGGEQINSLRYG
jgi:hypothetical protein